MSLKTERPPTSSIAASRRDDLITALLGSWLTIGGFVDGFAHRNLDTPETFFTPWHAILYTGYLTTGAWVFWLVVRNRRVADSLRGSIPTGYETTVGDHFGPAANLVAYLNEER